MKKLLLIVSLAYLTLGMQAQPPADTTPTYPSGATYTHSSGTSTITDNYSSSTQYYNVIQCTGGTLTMNGCTITKTGDGSGGDNSSFYGNNSSIYAGAASSTNYQSKTAASGAKIVINNVTVNGSAQGANAVIATNGASGDASGVNPVMTITGGSLTTTDTSAPLLEVATCVTATCTLSGVTVNAGSGILMYVMADSQWSTSGAVGNLILDDGEYSGIVKYDTGYTANVTVNSGAVWNLTGDATVSTLVNNGTINRNGYTLTVSGTTSGSGVINETTGIETIRHNQSLSGRTAYTVGGRLASADTKGIVIQDGKKVVIK